MLIFNSKGDRVEPTNILPLKFDDFDLIYGTMTTGKTSFIRNLWRTAKLPDPHLANRAIIDTDALWEVLFPTVPDIWEVKRNSPAVDNALSGVVRMITRELAVASGRTVITNMRMPFGRAVKVYRSGEDTFNKMASRAKLTSRPLKISRKQVLEWSQSWMPCEPEYEYNICLDSNEFLSDVFGIKTSPEDRLGVTPHLPGLIELVMEQFPDSSRNLTPDGSELKDYFLRRGGVR